MQILPYRSEDNRIEGMLITVVDQQIRSARALGRVGDVYPCHVPCKLPLLCYASSALAALPHSLLMCQASPPGVPSAGERSP